MKNISESEKQNNLKSISIHYYILGGLTIVSIGFMIKFFFDTQQMLIEAYQFNPFPHLTLSLGLMLFGELLFTFCLFLTRYSLQHKINRRFCFIFAGFLCIFFPIGTMLGSSTINALKKRPF